MRWEIILMMVLLIIGAVVFGVVIALVYQMKGLF